MATENPTDTCVDGVIAMTRVTSRNGKTYYKQAAPAKRDNPMARKSFYLVPGEGDAFDVDAASAGLSSVGYLRWLWAEDRKRRGLPPWSKEPSQ